MKRVLFVGDVNVDLIFAGLPVPPVLGKEVFCRSYYRTLGSPAVICGCAFAQLGGQATMMGMAGDDDNGRFMVEGMRRFGLDPTFVLLDPTYETGITVSIVHGNDRTQVTFLGAIEHFSPFEQLETAIERFDHIHLAGVYQQHKFVPSITAALRQAKSKGLTTSMDPQWDVKEAWHNMTDWLPLLDYFFVNQSEACSITRAETAEQAMGELLERTDCPVVKLAADGALVSSNSGVKRIPAYRAKVVDTTGAGDAFDAAFLFAILEKSFVRTRAARFGNFVAARACEYLGGVGDLGSFDSFALVQGVNDE